MTNGSFTYSVGLKENERIVVYVVVESLGAHGEAGDDLAPVRGLLCPGDDSGLDEVDDGVGDDFGVDPQILLVHEELDHRRAGIRPMPTSRVEPSSTSEAMYSPMARVRSAASGAHLARLRRRR